MSPVLESIQNDPFLRIPEYTLIYVNFPTNGSVAILKANAANDPSTEFWIFTVSSGLSTDEPSILPTSVGDGRKSITASKTL